LPKSSAQTRFLVSGSADNSMKLWSVSNGKLLYTWEFPTAVKRVSFSEDGKQIVCVTEQRMGHQCAIRVFNIDGSGEGTKRQSPLPTDSLKLPDNLLDSPTPSTESKEPQSIFYPVGSKATVCTFASALQKHLILTGHESGKVALFDYRTGEEVSSNEKAHMDTITDLQMSKDRTYFITSSKDKTARVRPFP
jgi:translation initiation factor 3 subunit I